MVLVTMGGNNEGLSESFVVDIFLFLLLLSQGIETIFSIALALLKVRHHVTWTLPGSLITERCWHISCLASEAIAVNNFLFWPLKFDESFEVFLNWNRDFSAFQTSRKDLLALDFEGVLKFFRVQLPKKYRAEEAAKELLQIAVSLKVRTLRNFTRGLVELGWRGDTAEQW